MDENAQTYSIKCVICADKAHGIHFGVNSCRACAAFFRRSIILNRKYKCRFNNACDVNKGIRCVCRCCRFSKCVEEGMDAKVLEKHNASNKILGSPPESEVETMQPIPIPSTSFSSAPFTLPIVKTNDDNEEKSYTILTKCPSIPMLPNDTLHLSMASHTNFVSNVIHNLNLGSLFSAELPRFPSINTETTPMVNEILRGYRKLCSLRKATERLIATSLSQKLFDPMEETLELTEARYDEHIAYVKHDLPLISEMLSEHFIPFGSFSTETKWAMLRQFHPTFVLSERSFTTSKIMPAKDDDIIFLYRRAYIRLSNISKFFTVPECKSNPERVAQVFQGTFRSVKDHVVNYIFDLALSEHEFSALLGALLFNDAIIGFSVDENKVITQTKESLYNELYSICQINRTIEDAGVRFAKIVSLIPLLHRLAGEIGQNFSLVKLMNIFDVDPFIYKVMPHAF